MTCPEGRSTASRRFCVSAVTSATGVPPCDAACEAAGTARIASSSSALFTPVLRGGGGPESLCERYDSGRVAPRRRRRDRAGRELDDEVRPVREALAFPAGRGARRGGQPPVGEPREPGVALEH